MLSLEPQPSRSPASTSAGVSLEDAARSLSPTAHQQFFQRDASYNADQAADEDWLPARKTWDAEAGNRADENDDAHGSAAAQAVLVLDSARYVGVIRPCPTYLPVSKLLTLKAFPPPQTPLCPRAERSNRSERGRVPGDIQTSSRWG